VRIMQTRRRFLTSVSLAGAASVLDAPSLLAAEGPPEITTIRFPKGPATCLAPQFAAEELLRAEGFSDIRYVDTASGAEFGEAIARGTVDFTMNFAVDHISRIDAGDPITILAGIMVGCVEAFGNEVIRSITDLKGKRVGVVQDGTTEKLLLSVMAAYVGVDLFAQGRIDAFLTIAPFSFDVRARNLGHSFVNSAVDRPWSQYFCCMLGGNREFVRKYPIATKRALRAILKTADLCVSDPTRVAQRLVDGGFARRYDYAFQGLREIPYDKWREYDAEDTIRFYALRLHELGMIKSSPQKIIANGTDWRFLNELKRELKA
jgi:NitT/TauT family transport system substrate-binding protein